MGRRTIGRIVVRQRPVAVERDTDLAALLRLELLAVELHGVGVREDDAVAHTSCRARLDVRIHRGSRVEWQQD